MKLGSVLTVVETGKSKYTTETIPVLHNVSNLSVDCSINPAGLITLAGKNDLVLALGDVVQFRLTSPQPLAQITITYGVTTLAPYNGRYSFNNGGNYYLNVTFPMIN